MYSKILSISKHPLFTGSMVMMAGMMGVNVINYVYHLVMGRVLGPQDYGSLAAVFSILYIAGIVPISSSFAIVKFVSAAKSRSDQEKFFNSVRQLFFKIGIGVLGALLLLSPAINNFLNINDLKTVLVIGPIVFFTLVTVVNMASMQGLLKFHGLVVPNIISSSGKLLVGIILVLLGLSFFGAVLGILVAAILAYLFSIKDIAKHLKIREYERPYKIKPFLKYSFPVLVQALAFTSLFSTDLILVKHFLPPFEAGLYAALSTLGKTIYFATSPITSIMFPFVSNKRSRGENYRKGFYISLVAVFMVGAMAILVFRYLPNLTIGLLYGQEYLAASGELVLMGVSLTLYALAHILVNFSLSVHKTSVVVYPALAALVQILALWRYHRNLREVLHINIFITLALLFTVLLYLVYNEVQRRNGLQTKKAK